MRASPTDILARKSARRTKVRGQARVSVESVDKSAKIVMRVRLVWQSERGSRRTRGHPCVEVGEDVRVGPMEFKLMRISFFQ